MAFLYQTVKWNITMEFKHGSTEQTCPRMIVEHSRECTDETDPTLEQANPEEAGYLLMWP